MSLCNENQDAVIIGSLGTISYDLTDISHPNKILIRGAMGAVLGAALGYALAKPGKKVMAFLGDGSFLMKMGGVATIMRYKPANLEVYILNNKQHRSTGGQHTNFESIKKYLPLHFKVIDFNEVPTDEGTSVPEPDPRTGATSSEPSEITWASSNRN